uniref:t-SNARE coiled-coil homology domain-containing protein n=1 Tax=Globodera pallida TaxID=36090 RepID=A0A183BV13_GLOPA
MCRMGEAVDDTLRPSQQRDDLYSGFNDYDHAYDLLEDGYGDRAFVQAVVRSSRGRHGLWPASPNRFGHCATRSVCMGSKRTLLGTGVARPTTVLRPALLSRARTGAASRAGAGAAESAARPMTAVRGAGYTSAGRKSTFEGVIGATEAPEGTDEEEAHAAKVKRLEDQVMKLVKESVLASDESDAKKALDKAKEAARKWRAADALRKAQSPGDANMDLSLTVLLCLAQQKQANNIPSEALQIYYTIIKDKSYVNAGRLKVNIGNLHFRKKDFSKAIKYYRMALDQVPKAHQRMRTKIMNNIGVTLVKLGKYEDALGAFEDCLDAGGSYGMALNLTLAAYCLNSEEKMRESFQRLMDIGQLGRGDEELRDQQQKEDDVLAAHLLSTDALALWERRKKQQAERTILLAAKIIAQSIAPTFSEGYAWCVQSIRHSVYASLATELEMNKVVEQLRHGELDQAVEELLVFNNKENKVASAASNNLALISILRGEDSLEDATQYCEQALSLDRYNANALVNRGNIHFCVDEFKLALQLYREALQVDASCTAAVFNSGLVCKALNELEEAKKHFFKLNEMVLHNEQVLVQLAQIYEQQGNNAQAIELYTQASSICPTDPTILARLANLYEAEGDKGQAFQCHYDSFRYFPPNIEVIRWLGNYYLYAQFAEKAVSYFEKAALMEPNNVEWHLLMASCQRRAGNFQRAVELYKETHRRFPNNFECLKFLVHLCKELRMSTEETEYAQRLARLERIGQLKAQRESDSAGANNSRQRLNESMVSPSGSGVRLQQSSNGSRPASSRRNSPNTAQKALQLLEGDQHFQATRRNIRVLNRLQASKRKAAAREKTQIRSVTVEDEQLHGRMGVDDPIQMRQLQQQHRMNLDEIRERQQALSALEQDIGDINQIFKDLAHMVHDQGEMVDSIEANIEHASIHVQEAHTNVAQAVHYQTKARQKKLMISAFCFIVFLVLFLVLYLWLKH